MPAFCAQVHMLEWTYKQPPRLSRRNQLAGTLVSTPQAMPLPSYTLPDFCEAIKSDEHNAQFLRFDNHPCTYLASGIVFPATIAELFA